MKRQRKRVMGCLLVILLVAVNANGFAKGNEGNWKRGRIYYRMVCTTCHVENGSESISPSEYTIAEWKDYLLADNHATSGQAANPSVSYYVSREYRESVKDTNKAAKKFLDIEQEKLAQDLRAFVVHGAKDSDTPSRCK